MSGCRVLCAANCKYNDGTGYYSLCEHDHFKNMPEYGGIDRRYVECCDLMEDRENVGDVNE